MTSVQLAPAIKRLHDIVVGLLELEVQSGNIYGKPLDISSCDRRFSITRRVETGLGGKMASCPVLTIHKCATTARIVFLSEHCISLHVNGEILFRSLVHSTTTEQGDLLIGKLSELADALEASGKCLKARLPSSPLENFLAI